MAMNNYTAPIRGIWSPSKNEIFKTLAPQGLYSTPSVDSLDWKGISAAEITERVTRKVAPGSIVLFHNAGEHTPEALPGILDHLLAQGYQIVPISEILLTGEYTIDHTGRQFAA